MKRSALGICVCSTDLNQQSSKDAKNLNRRTCRCGYTPSYADETCVDSNLNARRLRITPALSCAFAVSLGIARQSTWQVRVNHDGKGLAASQTTRRAYLVRFPS